MVESRKRGYFSIFLVILSLIFSPLSMANTDDTSLSLYIPSDDSVELGGFAKLSPIQNQGLFAKSEKTALKSGSGTDIGCCANPSIWGTAFQSAYCNPDPAAFIYGDMCCDSTSAPAVYQNCLNTMFFANSACPSGAGSKCALGCCRPNILGEACVNSTADTCAGIFNGANTCDQDPQCAAQTCCMNDTWTPSICKSGFNQTYCETTLHGTNFNNSCSAYPNCTGPGLPTTCSGKTQTNCTQSTGCGWCNYMTDGSQNVCTDACTGCSDTYYDAFNHRCLAAPLQECLNGIDDDSDGVKDIQNLTSNPGDPCCIDYVAVEDSSCSCPIGHTADFGSWQCPGGLFWNHMQYNASSPSEVCCIEMPVTVPTCTDKIKDNTGPRSYNGYCVCNGTAQNITGPNQNKSCCGGIMQDMSCVKYKLSGHITFKDRLETILPSPQEVNISLFQGGSLKASGTYDPSTQNYSVPNLYIGTYGLRVSSSGFIVHQDNNVVIDTNITRNFDLIQESQVPILCDTEWPQPQLIIQSIPCNKSLNISWNYDCSQVLPAASAYRLYISKLIGGANVYQNSFSNSTKSVIVPYYHFIPDTDYNITLVVSSAQVQYNNMTSETKFIGNKACFDNPTGCNQTDGFCLSGDPNNLYFCGEDNRLLAPQHCDGGCYESISGQTYCSNLVPCKDINTSMALNDPNIFGLYYYKYQNWCYYSDGTTIPNYCYYDIYNKKDIFIDTPTDSCLSCANVDSCYDYRSPDACNGTNGDFCTKSINLANRCRWYTSAENFQSLGMGICYDPEYNKTDKCGSCGPTSTEIFRRTGCTPNVCDALGACFSSPDKKKCFSCDRDIQSPNYTTCYNFTDNISCNGADGWSDPIGETPGILDGCDLGTCRWQSYPTGGGYCIKDGNSNTYDDCLSPGELNDSNNQANCRKDNKRPVTSLAAPPYLNSLNNTLTFTATDEYPDNVGIEISYCINTSTCNPVAFPGKTTETSNSISDIVYVGPGKALPDGINGTYNILFYSKDRYNNKEKMKNVSIFVDTARPHVNVSIFKFPNMANPSTTDLSFTITTDEDGTICSDSLSPNNPSPILTNTRIDKIDTKTITYTELPDSVYSYQLNCTDSFGNPARLIVDGVEVSNPIYISIDELLMIENIHPIYNDTYQAIFKAGIGSALLSLEISDPSGTLNYNCSYENSNLGIPTTYMQKSYQPPYHMFTSPFDTFRPHGEYSLSVTCKNTDTLIEDHSTFNLQIDANTPRTDFLINGINITSDSAYVSPGSTLTLEYNGDSFGPFNISKDWGYIQYCSNDAVLASCNPEMNFTWPITIAPQYPTRYCFKSTDYASNSETTRCKNITADNTGPSLTISTPQENFVTNLSSVYVNGIAVDSQSFVNRIYVRGLLTFIPGPSISWNKTVNIDPGLNTIEAIAWNTAGMSSQTSVNVFRDIYGPSFIDISLVDLNSTYAPVIFEYHSPINITVTINDSNYTAMDVQQNSVLLELRAVDADNNTIPGGLSQNYTLANDSTSTIFTMELHNSTIIIGRYQALFRARDRFGNERTETRYFNVNDTANPKLSVKIYEGADLKSALTNKVYTMIVESSEPLNSSSLRIDVSRSWDPTVVNSYYNPSYSPDNMTYNYTLVLTGANFESKQGEILFNITTAYDKEGNQGEIIDGASIGFNSIGPDKPTWIGMNPKFTSNASMIIAGAAALETVSVRLCNNAPTSCSSTITSNVGSGNTPYYSLPEGYTVDAVNARQFKVNFDTLELGGAGGKFLYFNDTSFQKENGLYYNITAATLSGGAYYLNVSENIHPLLIGSSTLGGFMIYDNYLPDGVFAFNVSSLSVGENNYTAWPVDDSGNMGNSSDVMDVIRGTSFAFTTPMPSNATTASNNVVVRIYTTEAFLAVNLSSIIFLIDNIPYTTINQCSVNYPNNPELGGTCGISASSTYLPNGQHNVSVSVRDALGELKAYSWYFYTSDQVIDPTVTIDGKVPDPIAYTNNQHPQITIAFPGNVNLTEANVTNGKGYYSNLSGCIHAGQTFSCSVQTPEIVNETTYYLTINSIQQGTTVVGNSIFTFYYDRTNPNVGYIFSHSTTGGNESHLGVASNANIDVNAEVSDNNPLSKVSFGGAVKNVVNVSASASGTYSANIELNSITDGQVLVNVTAYDAAGNNATASIPVTLSRPLMVEVINPPSGITFNNYLEPLRVRINNKNTSSCNLTFTNQSGTYTIVNMPKVIDNTFEVYSANIYGLNFVPDGILTTTMTMNCIDSTGMPQPATFEIIVNQESPNLTGYGILPPALEVPSADPNYKPYLITNPAAMSFIATIFARSDELLNCTFTVESNTGSNIYNPAPSDDIRQEIYVENNKIYIINVSCIGLNGKAIIPPGDKIINLTVNNSGYVNIYHVSPEGLTGQTSPSLIAWTDVNSSCSIKYLPSGPQATMSNPGTKEHYTSVLTLLGLASLTEGNYAFNVSCSDTTGLLLNSWKQFNFTFDNQIPELIVFYPNASYIDWQKLSMNFSVFASDSHPDKVLVIDATTGAIIGNVTMVSETTHTILVPLKIGTNYLFVRATDTAGNYINSSTYTIKVQKPVVDIIVEGQLLNETSPIYVSNPGASITLHFSDDYTDINIAYFRMSNLQAGKIITLSDEALWSQGNSQLSGFPMWGYTLSGANMLAASPSPYIVNVTLTANIEGQPQTYSKTFEMYYDEQDPNITSFYALGLDATNTTNVPEITVEGYVTDNIMVDRVQFTGDILEDFDITEVLGLPNANVTIGSPSGPFSMPLTLTPNDGNKTITAVAYDSAGRTIQRTIMVKINRPTIINWTYPLPINNEVLIKTATPLIKIETPGELSNNCSIYYEGINGNHFNEKMTDTGIIHSYQIQTGEEMNNDPNGEVYSTVTVTCTDEYGEDWPSSMNFKVDLQGPTIDQFYFDEPPSVLDTFASNNSFKKYLLYNTTQALFLKLVVSDESKCSYEVSGNTPIDGLHMFDEDYSSTKQAQFIYANGETYSIRILCEDKAGNVGEDKQMLLIVNDTMSVAVVNPMPRGIINDPRPLLSVDTVTPASCTIDEILSTGWLVGFFTAPKPMVPSNDNTHHEFVLNNDLDDDSYDFLVECSSIPPGVMQTGIGHITPSVDTDAPQIRLNSPIEMTSPDSDSYSNEEINITLIGNVSDENNNMTLDIFRAGKLVYNSSYGPSRTFNEEITLFAGYQDIVFYSTDEAGNTEEMTLTVYSNTAAANISINGYTLDVDYNDNPVKGNLTITLDFYDPLTISLHEVTLSGPSNHDIKNNCSVTNAATKTWTCDLGELADSGVYRIYVNASKTETNGSETYTDTEKDFYYDNDAPTLSIFSVNGFPSEQQNINLDTNLINIHIIASDNHIIDTIGLKGDIDSPQNIDGTSGYEDISLDMNLTGTDDYKIINVTVNDLAGNQYSAYKNITLIRPISIEWISPPDYVETRTPDVLIHTLDQIDNNCNITYISQTKTTKPMSRDGIAHNFSDYGSDLLYVQGTSQYYTTLNATCKDKNGYPNSSIKGIIIDMENPNITAQIDGYTDAGSRPGCDRYYLTTSSPVEPILSLSASEEVMCEYEYYAGTPEVHIGNWNVTDHFGMQMQSAPAQVWTGSGILRFTISCKDHVNKPSNTVNLCLNISGLHSINFYGLDPANETEIGDLHQLISVNTIPPGVSCSIAKLEPNGQPGTYHPMWANGVAQQIMLDTWELSNGFYDFKINCTDPSLGFQANSMSLRYTFNLDNPVVTLISPHIIYPETDMTVYDNVFRVNGTVSKRANVTLELNNDYYNSSMVESAGGEFDFDGIYLALGTNIITVTAEDIYGHQSEPVTRYIILDNTLPIPEAYIDGERIMGANTILTNNSMPSFTLNFSSVTDINLTKFDLVGGGNRLHLIGVPTLLGPTDTYSVILDYNTKMNLSGQYYLDVSAINMINGTMEYSEFYFGYDAENPTLQIIAPEITNDPTFDIDISATDITQALGAGINRTELSGGIIAQTLFGNPTLATVTLNSDDEGVYTIIGTTYDNSGRHDTVTETLTLSYPTTIDWVGLGYDNKYYVTSENITITLKTEPDKMNDNCTLTFTKKGEIITTAPMTENGKSHEVDIINLIYETAGTKESILYARCTDEVGRNFPSQVNIIVDKTGAPQFPEIDSVRLESGYTIDLGYNTQLGCHEYFVNNALSSATIYAETNKETYCTYTSIGGATINFTSPNDLTRYHTSSEIQYSGFTGMWTSNISCEDLAGQKTSPTRKICLNVTDPANASIGIYNITLSPYDMITAPDNVISADTMIDAACTLRRGTSSVSMGTGLIHSASISGLVDANLTNATYTFTINCTDNSGNNFKSGSAEVTYYKHIGPIITVYNPSTTPITVDTLAFTLNASVSFESNVTVTLNGNAIIDYEEKNGIFTEDLTLNASGNELVISAVDEYGLYAVPKTFIININDSVPLANAYADNDMINGNDYLYMKNNMSNLSLDFTPSTGVASVRLDSVVLYRPNGQAPLDLLTPPQILSQKRWSHLITGSETFTEPGVYTLAVVASNNATGYTSPIQSYSFTFDNNRPSISLFIDEDGIVDSPEITAEIIASDESPLTAIYIGGDVAAQTLPGDSTSVALTLPGTDGLYQVTASAVDKAGWQSTTIEPIRLSRQTSIQWMGTDEYGNYNFLSEDVKITIDTPQKINDSCAITYTHDDGISRTIPMQSTLTTHSANLVNVLNDLEGQRTSPLAVDCIDEIGRPFHSETQITIDKQVPQLILESVRLIPGTYAEFQENYDEYGCEGIYLSTDPQGLTQILADTNKGTACYYELTKGGITIGTSPFNVPIEYTTSHTSENIPFLGFAGIIGLNVTCKDGMGQWTESKKLCLNVTGNAGVLIYDVKLNPYDKITDISNYITAKTVPEADCTIRRGASSASMWAGLDHSAYLGDILGWSTTLTHLQNFTFDITCTDISGKGFKPVSMTVNYTVYKSGPIVDVYNPNTSPITVNALAFTMNASVNVNADVTVILNGAPIVDNEKKLGGFEVPMTLNASGNTLTVYAVNEYGFSSTPQTFTININSSVPVGSAFIDGNIINGYTFTGNNQSNISLDFTSTSVPVQLNYVGLEGPSYSQALLTSNTGLSNKQWSYELTPGQALEKSGTYILTVDSSNPITGFAVQTKYNFTYDGEYPSLSLVAVTIDGEHVTSQEVTIGVSASDPIGLVSISYGGQITDGRTISVNDYAFAEITTVHLASDLETPQLITVSAVDKVGHKSERIVNVTLSKESIPVWTESPIYTKDIQKEITVITPGKSNDTCVLTYIGQDGELATATMSRDMQTHTMTKSLYGMNSLYNLPGDIAQSDLLATCTDEIGRIFQSSQNEVTVDLIQLPGIDGISLNGAIYAGDSNYCHNYISAQLDGIASINILANKDVKCEYTKTYNSGAPTTYPFFMNDPTYYDNQMTSDNITWHGGGNYRFTVVCEDHVQQSTQPESICLNIPNQPTAVNIVSVYAAPNDTGLNPAKVFNNTILHVETQFNSNCTVKYATSNAVVMSDQNSMTHNLALTSITALANEQAYPFNITCYDKSGAGFISNSQTATYRADTFGPYLSITNPSVPSSVSDNIALTIEGAVTEDATITITDNGELVDQTYVSMGSFSLPMNLKVGDLNRITVATADIYGFAGQSRSFNVTLNPLPYANLYLNGEWMSGMTYTADPDPVIKVSFPQQAMGLTMTKLKLISPDGSERQLETSPIHLSAPINRTYDLVSPALTQIGIYTVIVEAVSDEGEWATGSYPFYFDTTIPSIEHFEVAEVDGGYVNTMDIHAISYAYDGESEFVNATLSGSIGTKTMPASGHDLFIDNEALTLSSSSETVKNVNLKVFNKLGFSANQTVAFTLNMPTVLTWVTPVDFKTNSTTPTIRIRTSDDQNYCELNGETMNKTNARDFTIVLSYELDAIPEEEIENDMYLECEDQFGFPVTDYKNITVDMKAPSIFDISLSYGDLLSEEATNKTYMISNITTTGTVDLIINASEEVNCSYTIIESNQTSLGSTDDFASYSIVPIGIADGKTYIITVRCVDWVGLASENIGRIGLTVDSEKLIAILDVNPKGYTNEHTPTIVAETAQPANCRLRYNGTLKNMTTSDNKIHEVPVTEFEALEAGLVNNRTYNFTVICNKSNPTDNYGVGTRNFNFRTDFDAPVLRLVSPNVTIWTELVPETMVTVDVVETSGQNVDLLILDETGEPIITQSMKGTYTIEHIPLLIEGYNNLSLIARDAAGTFSNQINISVWSPGLLVCFIVEGEESESCDYVFEYMLETYGKKVNPFTCFNGVRDTYESDIDCGGSQCTKACFQGFNCIQNSDCLSGICTMYICQ